MPIDVSGMVFTSPGCRRSSLLTTSIFIFFSVLLFVSIKLEPDTMFVSRPKLEQSGTYLVAHRLQGYSGILVTGRREGLFGV